MPQNLTPPAAGSPLASDILVDTPVGTFAVLDHGGSGPDILLVHQAITNAMVWAPHIPELTTFGHVWAVDLRGHGRTPSEVEHPEQIAADLPHIVRALGLSRPLIVAEGNDVLVSGTAPVLESDPCGVVLIGDACPRHGEDAREWYEEQYGLEALDSWAERFGLFAQGTADTREEWLDTLVAKARADWLAHTASADMWRAYLERGIHEEPDGSWHRRPRRDVYEGFARLALAGPMGIDLYDSLDLPLCFLDTVSDLSQKDQQELAAYAASRPDRSVVVVAGGPIVPTVEAPAASLAIRSFLHDCLDRVPKQA